MDRERCLDSYEGVFRRVVLPVIGVAGVVYEEFHGTVDTALLGVYLALIGLGVTPWLRDLLAGKRAGNG
jgi:hypothetical protein